MFWIETELLGRILTGIFGFFRVSIIQRILSSFVTPLQFGGSRIALKSLSRADALSTGSY